MSTLISATNFRKACSEWGDALQHAMYLAPFLAIHEAAKAKDIIYEKESKLWTWERARTLRKTREIVWQLAGEWGARRNVPVSSLESFQNTTDRVVRALAREFNRHDVMSLSHLVGLSWKQYKRIAERIERGVKNISRQRDTTRIEPLLGSKILHHFFPSLVPVYDDMFISKRVLRMQYLKDLLEKEQDDWSFSDYGEEKRMQEYHVYFALCAQQIHDTRRTTIQSLRERLAGLYKDLVPHVLVRKRRSLLYQLDAKLAEYCLIGATY